MVRSSSMVRSQCSPVTIADRKAEVEKGPKAVAARCLAELKAAGIDSVPVVTGGGTGTFELDVASGTHTEVQPGSYLFMDGDYGRNADTPSKFAQSLYVHTTVISAARGKRVVDAGSKAVDLLSGVPKAVAIDGAAPPGLDAVVFSSGGDEHGVLRGDALDDDAVLPVGSTLQLVPGHCDPTVTCTTSSSACATASSRTCGRSTRAGRAEIYSSLN